MMKAPEKNEQEGLKTDVLGIGEVQVKPMPTVAMAVSQIEALVLGVAFTDFVG
jgi:hypothetical protein